MTLRVRLDPGALGELHAARDWYERRSPGVGYSLVGDVWEIIDQVAAWPALAPTVPVPGTSREVRRASLSRFPYGVIYTVIDDVIWVVAIAHGRRRPGYWHERLTE